MLKLKKYINRVTHQGAKDIEALRAALPAYEERGIDAVANVLESQGYPVYIRVDALVILGTERTQLPNGDPLLMKLLEDLAETAEPDLDLVCFVGVYANALKGRTEAAALVDRFMVGTDRQRVMFKTTDAQYMQGLAAKEAALRHAAAFDRMIKHS